MAWRNGNGTDLELIQSSHSFTTVGIECPDVPERPSTVEYLKGLKVYEKVLLAVTIVATVFTWTVYVHNVRQVRAIYQGQRHNQRGTLFIISMIPFSSVVVLACALVPRLSALADVPVSWIIAMGLYHFVVTLFDQFHGLDKMAAAVEFERVPVGSPPLCCFYCCSPRLRPTRTVLRWARVGMLQAAVFQPFLALLASLCFFNGHFEKGWLHPHSAWMYLTICKTVSTMSAVYSLNVLVKANSLLNSKLVLGVKRFSVQGTMMLFNIQNTILSCLSFLQNPACFGHYISPIWIEVIFYGVLSVQYATISSIMAVKLRNSRHKNSRSGEDDLEALHDGSGDMDNNSINSINSGTAPANPHTDNNTSSQLKRSVLDISDKLIHPLCPSTHRASVFANGDSILATYGAINSKGDR